MERQRLCPLRQSCCVATACRCSLRRMPNGAAPIYRGDRTARIRFSHRCCDQGDEVQAQAFLCTGVCPRNRGCAARPSGRHRQLVTGSIALAQTSVAWFQSCARDMQANTKKDRLAVGEKCSAGSRNAIPVRPQRSASTTQPRGRIRSPWHAGYTPCFDR